MDPMSIEYQVTLEDLVAFKADVRESSPVFRRALRRAQVTRLVIAALMTVVVVAGITLKSRLTVMVGAAIALGMVLNAASLPMRIARSDEASLRKLYSDGTNPGILGWHRLSLSADGLVEESEIGHSSTRYSAIQRLSETPDHLFVYVGSLHGRAIAKNRIQSGDLDEFKTALQDRLDKR